MKEVLETNSEFIKEIPGFSRYLCDIKNGKIYRKPTDKRSGDWLNPKPNDIGYVYTSLINNEGKSETVSLHNCVISSAIEQPVTWWTSKNLEIDHRDRNKANNSYFNLCLCDKSTNHKNREIQYNNKRFTPDEVNAIKQEFEKWNGRKIEFYKYIADIYGCVWQTIQYMLLGYSYKKVTMES